MDKFSFPGWAGPIVGVAVGVGLGLAQGLQEGPGISAPWLILWSAAGAAAGSIVWVVDASIRKRGRHEDRPTRRQPAIDSPVVRGGLWFWLALLMLIGLVIGYLGVERFRRAWQMSRWPTVQATIRESHVKTSSHTSLNITTESFTPMIRYRYTIDGVEREGRAIDQSPLDISHSERSKAQAIVIRYPAGSTHPVYHDPENPAHAILESGVPWGDAVLFVLVPLASLGMALLTFLSLRVEQEETAAAAALPRVE